MDSAPQWPRYILKVFGFANLFFSLTGLFILVVMTVTFSLYSHLTQNLSSYNYFFIATSVLNLIFLIGLFITGWSLIKGSVKLIQYCNILYLMELICAYSIKALISLTDPQGSVGVAGALVGNMGISLQIFTFYPIIALVVLNFVNFKFKELLKGDRKLEPVTEQDRSSKALLGVNIFAYWFMLFSLISIGGTIWVCRNFGYDLSPYIQINLPLYFLTFITGFFILKRKEWARGGIIILAAASFFLTIAYSNVPYFRDVMQKDQIQAKRYQSVQQQSVMERMEVEGSDSYYYEVKTKEMMKGIEKKIQSDERSPLLKQVPVVLSLLWFLLVFFFFTRSRVKELFTWDPDIGKGGRFLVRSLAILSMIVLYGNLYLSKVEPRQNEYWRLGQALMAHGNNDAAIKVFSQGIRIPPGNGRLYASRGIAYRNLAQWQKAIEDYSKALWFDPGNKELFLRRGYAYEMRGNIDKALQDYDKALLLDPYYIQVLLNRSNIYLERGMNDKALSDSYLIIKHDPQNHDGQLNIGCVYDRLKRPLTALQHFIKAVELNPNDAQGHINLAKIYLDIGRNEKAIDEANKAIVLDPKAADAYRKRAAAWYNANEFVRYAQDWMMVHKIDPKDSEAPYRAMDGYYRAGDSLKVKEVHDMILKIGESSSFLGAGSFDLMVQTHPDGVVKGFDKQRKIIYERTFKNGKLNGIARDFNEKGQLVDEFNYANGLLNGVWKNYKDGRLLQEWDFKDDRIEGKKSKQYTNDGHVECSWTYRGNDPNGPYTCYYPNGKVQWQGNYKKGFLNGVQKSYYENGTPWTEENYHLGDKDGIQLRFNDKGKKIAESFFKEGVLEKSWFSKDAF